MKMSAKCDVYTRYCSKAIQLPPPSPIPAHPVYEAAKAKTVPGSPAHNKTIRSCLLLMRRYYQRQILAARSKFRTYPSLSLLGARN
jgi:hypothetical protein